MRIALVITELDPGGAERCLTELAIDIARSGHRTLVLTLGRLPASPYDDLVQRLTAAGIEVRSGNAHGPWSLWRIVRWLRAELDAFSPHLVQAMLWHANVISAIALRGHKAVLVGGMRVSEPRQWRWPIERWAVQRMACMVCVSEDVRKHALNKERLAADKLLVVPNGIRIEPSQASELRNWSELGISDNQRVLLFVGRFEPQKGAVSLARHAGKLLDGQSGWSLVFMGKGSEQASIEAALGREASGQSVRIVGWQGQANRWMAVSDIVLLPAQYEGMPNVLLEAMAAAKPFVAFSVDGVAQLLANSYPADLARAQLAPPGDWETFTSRVRTLMADTDLRHACSKANRAQVAQHFRLEDQLSKYQALYQTLVPQPSR